MPSDKGCLTTVIFPFRWQTKLGLHMNDVRSRTDRDELVQKLEEGMKVSHGAFVKCPFTHAP
jgi:hypothetical protein